MADLLSVKPALVMPMSEEPSLTPTPTPTDLGEDTRSTLTLSSAAGSYADFQSQAELCPTSVKKQKQSSSSVEKKDLFSDVEGNKNNKGEEKVYKGIKRYAGMLLTLFASICFSLAVLFVKMLKEYKFDAYGSSFWRYIGITVPTIPILMFYHCGPGASTKEKENGEKVSIFDSVWPVFENDNWKTWIGLFSRGLIGSSSVILRYYALQYLSIGDTSVITYSTPVLVTVMAHFCLGERCGVVSIVIAFTTLAGVIIVTKPPLLTGEESFDTDTLIGTGLACGSLFCSSLIVIITRKIREVHFALMILVFGTIGVAQALIMSLTLGNGTINVPSELNDSLLTAGLAGLSFVGQMAIILALKFEQAGPVALIRSCDVLFGFLLQFLFLQEVPDLFSSVGAVIVLFGVLVTAARKWIKTMPEDNKTRQTWSCLLR